MFIQKLDMFYLHGFVVNTENGTFCLNSSVMWSAKGGLLETHLSTSIQTTEHKLYKKNLDVYLGRMAPGPGSSGPGTNTKRLLQIWDEQI